MEVCTASPHTRVLLTGAPGVGKTTVCKEIISILREKHREVAGFYTEEVRDRYGRIGFDVVALLPTDQGRDSRSVLARAERVLDRQSRSRHRLGSYHVFTDRLEAAVLPSLRSDADLLLIDEIGKMELLSPKFHATVEAIFFGSSYKNVRIVATIPLMNKVSHHLQPLFGALRANDATRVVAVSYENRDDLPQEILDDLSL